MDNLNTHRPASLYEALPPTDARRWIETPEIHDTPKYGGWLDMAETGSGVPSRQGRDRRSPQIAIP
jgi:hypothetical protein